jgi:hypothetical protein
MIGGEVGFNQIVVLLVPDCSGKPMQVENYFF